MVSTRTMAPCSNACPSSRGSSGVKAIFVIVSQIPGVWSSNAAIASCICSSLKNVPIRNSRRCLDGIAGLQSTPHHKQGHDDCNNGEPKEGRNRRLMVHVGYVHHKPY